MARTTSVRCDRCFRPIGRDGSVFTARCEDLKTILHDVPTSHAFDLCLGCTTGFVEWVTRGRAESTWAAALVGPGDPARLPEGRPVAAGAIVAARRTPLIGE